MKELLHAVRAKTLVISFNNEGYMDRQTMDTILAELFEGRAQVTTIENDYKRYVGAQFGIHDLQGNKVGKVSHLRNKEYLYVVSQNDLSEQLSSLADRSTDERPLFV